jgi:pyruvate dehydrogenase E2 component (dihydrolipoamide acetyltransferase)
MPSDCGGSPGRSTTRPPARARAPATPPPTPAAPTRLRGSARPPHDLATRARSRKLNADDIAGGTFTITNPGPFGTFMTGAIINQPQVAILATDGITRRPVVVTDELGGESIAIHSVGLLTVNFDHRAIDGAYAAAFLAKAKQVIEQTSWEQEL